MYCYIYYLCAMIKEKQTAVINCLQTGRYIIKDDKIYNKKGRELFTRSLPTGYIQCSMFNGKRYGKGIKVIAYKHIVIYLHNFGEYSPELVIDHKDNNNRNNIPDNLQAITQSKNKAKSPTLSKSDYIGIRSAEIAQIRQLLLTTNNCSEISRIINRKRTATLYIIKQIKAGNPIKYE